MVDGSVTISIEDFQALIDAKVRADEIKENVKLVTKELRVFLSFLCTRKNIEEHVDEFNRQSKTATIVIENNVAKIHLKNVK